MKYIFSAVLAICLMLGNASAEDLLESSGVYEINSVTEDFKFTDIVSKFISGDGLSPLEFIGSAVRILMKHMHDNLEILFKIILLALCVCLMQAFAPPGKSRMPDISFYVCYMAVFILCMKSISDCAAISSEAIEAMNFFMRAAVPVLGGLMASAGGAARVVAVSTSIFTASTAISAIGSFILPLTKISAVLCGVNHICGDMNLTPLTETVKKTALWTFGIIMLVFTAFIGTQSLAATGADSVAIKTAKFAAGNFLPIVGGTLSDTMDSIITSARAVKGAVGAAGIIALIYICVSPVLKLAAIAAAYRLAAIVISPFADKRLRMAIEGFASMITVMMALVIGSAIMFIICAGIVCAM